MGLKYMPFENLIDLVMDDFIEKNIEELKLIGYKLATIHLIDDREHKEIEEYTEVIELR